MNYDSYRAKEHTGECEASSPLCNSAIKLGVAIIGEANVTGVSRLTLTGPCGGVGGRAPAPEHAASRTADNGFRTAPHDHAGSEDGHEETSCNCAVLC